MPNMVKIKPKDLVGLKLPEALAVLYDSDKPIKIGAKDGTAFFYAGSVQGAAASIDEISAEQYKRFEDTRANAQTRLRRAAANFPHMTEKMKAASVGQMVYRIKADAEKLSATEKYLRFLVDVGSYADNVLTLRSYVRTAKELLDRFKPMRERKVVEAFYADPVADAARPLVIMIDGFEYGQFWTMDEVDE